MRTLADPQDFHTTMQAYRARGLRTALVPTMGSLHEGHQALMRAAVANNDVVAVSIFVNPKQFGAKEDLARYPRDLPGDLQKCADAGVTLVFAPDVLGMYPGGFETTVTVERSSQGFCGGSRSGHFAGVTTIVTKLFLLAGAHVAYFGEKDFQQLAVIRAMVRDLCIPIEVVGVPTVREPDGLALSSRNVFLSPAERQDALVLRRALAAMRAAAEAGERSSLAITDAARALVAAVPSVRLDYVEVADALSLRQAPQIAAPTQALIAAFVGSTRLIDNLRIL